MVFFDEKKLFERIFEYVVQNIMNLYNLDKIGKFKYEVCVEEDFDYHKGWRCVACDHVIGYLLRSKSNPRELYIVSTCVDGVNVGTTVLYKPRFVSRVIRHMCMSEAQGKFTTLDEIEKWINECVDNVVSKLTPSEIRGDVLIALRNFFKIYNADVSINTMLRIGILRCVNSPNFEDNSIKCLP